ncbi:kinase [Cryptosporangium minutisporangium]
MQRSPENPDPVLIVVRGNSGSGKSTVAAALQRRHGRGCALVEQDYLRRIVLRERDYPGGLAPRMVAQTARLALDHGYHVVVEGILTASRYRDVLVELAAGHRGRSTFFYLDVSLEETFRRHAARPQATLFSTADMASWYEPYDVLGAPNEHVVPESSGVEETIAFVAATGGLPQDGRTDDFLPLAAEPRAVRAQRSSARNPRTHTASG